MHYKEVGVSDQELEKILKIRLLGTSDVLLFMVKLSKLHWVQMCLLNIEVTAHHWRCTRTFFCPKQEVSNLLCLLGFEVCLFNLHIEIDPGVNSSSCVLDWNRDYETGNMSTWVEWGKKKKALKPKRQYKVFKVSSFLKEEEKILKKKWVVRNKGSERSRTDQDSIQGKIFLN